MAVLLEYALATLGLVATLVMFVRVSVPVMPPVVDRSVAGEFELRSTPVEVVFPIGRVNMCRSRFASKLMPNDTVVVLLLVVEVVGVFVGWSMVVGEPNTVCVLFVVLSVEPVPMPTPDVLVVPTGTLSVPAKTIPFSGFGMGRATV